MGFGLRYYAAFALSMSLSLQVYADCETTCTEGSSECNSECPMDEWGAAACHLVCHITTRICTTHCKDKKDKGSSLTGGLTPMGPNAGDFPPQVSPVDPKCLVDGCPWTGPILLDPIPIQPKPSRTCWLDACIHTPEPVFSSDINDRPWPPPRCLLDGCRVTPGLRGNDWLRQGMIPSVH